MSPPNWELQLFKVLQEKTPGGLEFSDFRAWLSILPNKRYNLTITNKHQQSVEAEGRVDLHMSPCTVMERRKATEANIRIVPIPPRRDQGSHRPRALSEMISGVRVSFGEPDPTSTVTFDFGVLPEGVCLPGGELVIGTRMLAKLLQQDVFYQAMFYDVMAELGRFGQADH